MNPLLNLFLIPIFLLASNHSSYIEKVLPSVVSLTIYTHNGYQSQESLGTGFVYNDQGIIVTNAHVVKSASNKIIATFSNNKNCFATLQGLDEETDIATLKLEPNCPAPKAKIGSDESLRIGDQVIAIGNPLGLSQTVTQGIVSSLHRDGIFPDKPSDFIQTDAAINPGNSGGPLINPKGEVIGINTAFITSNPEDHSPSNSGMGLAIPISTATPIIEQLIKNGSVTRGYVGLMVQELSHSLANYFDFPLDHGLLVTNVVPKSPAAQAGIKEGDIITQINQQKLLNITQFPLFVSSNPPGSEINLSLWRLGKTTKMVVTSVPEAEITDLIHQNSKSNANPFNGVTLSKVDARSHDNKPLKGLQVINIAPDCEAFIEGLVINDIITHINDSPINEFDQLSLFKDNNQQMHAKITINRQGQKRFLAIRLNHE